MSHIGLSIWFTVVWLQFTIALSSPLDTVYCTGYCGMGSLTVIWPSNCRAYNSLLISPHNQKVCTLYCCFIRKSLPSTCTNVMYAFHWCTYACMRARTHTHTHTHLIFCLLILIRSGDWWRWSVCQRSHLLSWALRSHLGTKQRQSSICGITVGPLWAVIPAWRVDQLRRQCYLCSCQCQIQNGCLRKNQVPCVTCNLKLSIVCRVELKVEPITLNATITKLEKELEIGHPFIKCRTITIAYHWLPPLYSEFVLANWIESNKSWGK